MNDVLDIQVKPISELPKDEPPDTSGQEATGWYDPAYPHSTEDHPYGYFADKNGEPDFNRPRKRRPHSRSGGRSVATSDRADKVAETAAAMLARMNTFAGMALMSFGLPASGEALRDANKVFEEMAYQALQTDPTLARKILSAGATSGRAQLTMAYVMLGGSIAPSVISEVKARRAEQDEEALA